MVKSMTTEDFKVWYEKMRYPEVARLLEEVKIKVECDIIKNDKEDHLA